MTEIAIERRVNAPPAAVWALLTDPAAWVDWAGYDTVVVEQAEDSSQLRLSVSGETLLRERHSPAASARSYRYEHLSGLPVRRYDGQITLSDEESDTTTLLWRAEVEPLTQDCTAIVTVLRTTLTRAADGLVASAEARRRV